MILFVSGRCDIPAYYSTWFYNRIKEGYVDVRNPFNAHQISRIYLNSEQIDAIQFCTKNPIPMIERLDELGDIPYMFHITITPYHNDIERNVPDKRRIIEAIKMLSKKIGKDRVILRYDPIVLTKTYTTSYHIKAFASLSKQLSGYISTCIISFVDEYKNMKAHAKEMGFLPIVEEDMKTIGKAFGEIAQTNHMKIQTCAEDVDLSPYHIEQGACISKDIMENLLNRPYEPPKGKAIRECKFLPTVDIGDYNYCAHYCGYCYANYDETMIKKRMKLHDPNSSVLLGHIEKDDVIHERKKKGIQQIKLL